MFLNTYRMHVDKELMLVLLRRRDALDGRNEVLIGQVEVREAQ